SRYGPELIISTRVARCGRTINATLSCSLFQFGRLVIRKKLFHSKLLVSFDGRDGSITPNSLQVGVAPRSMCRSPLLRGPSSFRGLGYGEAGQQHKQNHDCQTTAPSETWGNHLYPRFPGLARIRF